MILETKRLLLRPWEEADAEECYKYAKDPLVGPSCGWVPHTSVEVSKVIIKNVLSVPETYAIIWKETNLPIGNIVLKMGTDTDLTEEEDECELGYWLGVPYWGKGIMPEAAKELIRHGFEDLGMKKIWCAYYDGNEKSKRVQEKCGFQYQWTTHDGEVPLLQEKRTGHVNCLTKKEWDRRKQQELGAHLLESCDTLQLGIINENGFPMIYPMEKVTSVAIDKVLFITKKDSDKGKAIGKCEKSCIECYTDETILWLLGKIEIIKDFEIIKSLLPEKYWERLMKHENYRDYCVLLFKTGTATIYENGKKYVIKELDSDIPDGRNLL